MTTIEIDEWERYDLLMALWFSTLEWSETVTGQRVAHGAVESSMSQVDRTRALVRKLGGDPNQQGFGATPPS